MSQNKGSDGQYGRDDIDVGNEIPKDEKDSKKSERNIPFFKRQHYDNDLTFCQKFISYFFETSIETIFLCEFKITYILSNFLYPLKSLVLQL